MQKQRGWTRQHETHNSRRTQSPEELVFQLDQSDFWAIRLDCTLLFTCFTRWLSSRTAAACLESAAYVSETVTGAAGPGFTPAVRVEDPPGRGTFLNLYIIFPQEKKADFTSAARVTLSEDFWFLICDSFRNSIYTTEVIGEEESSCGGSESQQNVVAFQIIPHGVPPCDIPEMYLFINLNLK